MSKRPIRRPYVVCVRLTKEEQKALRKLCRKGELVSECMRRLLEQALRPPSFADPPETPE